jgi:hypothetical protein
MCESCGGHLATRAGHMATMTDLADRLRSVLPVDPARAAGRQQSSKGCEDRRTYRLISAIAAKARRLSPGQGRHNQSAGWTDPDGRKRYVGWAHAKVSLTIP